MFRGFELPRKLYGWWLLYLKYINKYTGESFSGYKTLSKVWLFYLEVKLQQGSYNQCIYKLKCHKIGTNEIFEGKEAVKKLSLLFLKLEMQLRHNRLV